MYAKTWLATVLLIAFSTGCGPSFTLQPLVGDDPEVLHLLGVSPESMETPATVSVVETFYRDLWSNNPDPIWTALTHDTQVELDRLATQVDTNGKALLQTRQFPRVNGAGTLRVSLAALFLVRRPTRFEATAPLTASDTTASVRVTNRSNESRTVALRLERGQWKIHQTEYTTLPAARDLRPQLLPPDMEAITPQAPPAEPAGSAPPEVGSEEPASNDSVSDEDEDEDEDGSTEPEGAAEPAPAPEPSLDF